MKVEFRNVVKNYGNTVAVNDLNLTLSDGALHFLLGPSGCGKTTTLRMLAGLENVTDGQILFDDKDVTNLPAAERGIGMVFQNYALWPHMTVYENVEYGLKLRKLSNSEVASRIQEVLDITQLTRYSDRLPGQLSGGQQQRVALARALAVRPNVLLLDEPLSNLDAKLRLEMRENITRIHRKTGITTLYVTHDQKESLSMGTMITVMHAGNLVQTGTPRELYNNPNTPFLAGFIGETNILDGQVTKYEAGSLAVVSTKLGDVVCGNVRVNNLKLSDKVSVSVRPEAISICGANELSSKDQDENFNCYTINLERLTYLGESEQLTLLHSDNETELRANVFNPEDHEHLILKPVHCFFHMRDAVLLPAVEDLGPGT